MIETTNDVPDIVLLHSNDIHSRLEQTAKMAAYMEDTRRMYGKSRVLTLDIGDHMDRMRVETEASDGLVNIALMNAAGYDAVTLGNNEGLTFTPEQLDAGFREHAQFQTVCANIVQMSDGQRPTWMRPYAMIEKAGLRIGIIGVTAAFAEFYRLLGWEAGDPLKAVAEQVDLIRSEADIVVIMSHLGLPLDRRMAQEIPGIDLILGGHTHHLLEEPEMIGGTCICATGKFGEYIGRVEIRLDAQTNRPSFQAVCIPTAELREDEEAAAIIGSFLESGRSRLSRVITVLDAPLPARPEQESPLSNLLAAGLRRWTGAEIGIVNTGQLLDGLGEGAVTAGDLHALCPSPINPCRMKLTGAVIRRSLEQALQRDYIDKPIRGFGFRGLVLGTLAVDGLDIQYDPNRKPNEQITAVTVNGLPLQDSRSYTVGTIDMFTFGVGYEKIKDGTEISYFLPEFIRDVLERELRNSEAIQDSRRKRWLRMD
ncbi:bifunctional UDP-sugar hydrolase/5'-nucleotidase [Paenibacillus sp. R14(2021)]|uniref:bifunctional metallophosphatase/5'-nucleotidase n=1 Tax=Paenibacillus sp. R14(2021) TaxID=2859228 RepID=UPI001C6144D3|nr:bifunctional UDP-sugar hydrolase/5'-nucleotidase [Paenibacillus sp. R14(2021)]